VLIRAYFYKTPIKGEGTICRFLEHKSGNGEQRRKTPVKNADKDQYPAYAPVFGMQLLNTNFPTTLFFFSDICKSWVLDLLLLCLCLVKSLITDSAVSVSVSSRHVLLDFYFVRVLILQVYIAHLKTQLFICGAHGFNLPCLQ
jgi:hypothetical protein